MRSIGAAAAVEEAKTNGDYTAREKYKTEISKGDRQDCNNIKHIFLYVFNILEIKMKFGFLHRPLETMSDGVSWCGVEAAIELVR